MYGTYSHCRGTNAKKRTDIVEERTQEETDLGCSTDARDTPFFGFRDS
jgi:hypothetical protein